MNELKIINGVECFIDEKGIVQLKLENVARGLGFTQIKNDNEYIRWDRIKAYLDSFEFSPEVGKEDFIPEPIFYLLSMKADSINAKKFQKKVAYEILPSIRATGSYNKPLTEKEMMRLQLSMIDDVTERVERLENNMVIDYGQQQVLKEKVNAIVIHWLGGKGSNAYREMSRKAYSECNHDFQNYFSVNSRNNTPKLKFDDAVYYISHWEPCNNTKLEIHNCNAQMSLTD